MRKPSSAKACTRRGARRSISSARKCAIFFFDNALYWLNEYRFDGLRLDAVHAINDDEWLRELAQRVRSSVEASRHVHLVLENEHNTANLLETHFDAQWNDDAHNTLHVLLTGEDESYYGAYCDKPIEKLARVLTEGFAYQGDPSPIHDGKPRGEKSAHLPPTRFVMFLQNHDQIGNRAMGDRLRSLTDDESLFAATGLLLLSPQIPLLFMEEQYGSKQPFLFFTDYHDQLADAVREGRRKEFAKFSAFTDEKRRAQIPDPNDAKTFEMSSPKLSRQTGRSGPARMAALLSLGAHGAREARHAASEGREIARSGCARRQGARRALEARRRRDAERRAESRRERRRVEGAPPGKLVFETPARAQDRARDGELGGRTFLAWLTGEVNEYAIAHDARRFEPASAEGKVS